MTTRVRVTKGLLWAMVGLAAGVSLLRLARGPGAIPAVPDVAPWGLWNGLLISGGLGLAAGAFLVAGSAHLLRGRYGQAVRPAILIALAGYGAVAGGLLYDLGLPWHASHLTTFWNSRAPLLEVGGSVVLYLAILILALGPVCLERTRFQVLCRGLLRLRLPVILAGLAIATLQQSAIGSLVSSSPFRLHELWHTPLLRELFVVTGICLGLAMVIVQSSVVSWLYRLPSQADLIASLARAAAWALAFQLVFRLGDLGRRGELARAFDWGREAGLFQLEILLSSVLPLVLFSVPRLRRRPGVMFGAAAACVAGFLLHRIGVAGLAHVSVTGSRSLPFWPEFAVSLGIVAAVALAVLWIQERVPVDPDAFDAERAATWAQQFELPRLDGSRVWLGDAGFATRRVYSLAFTLAFAASLALTSWPPPAQASPIERAGDGDRLRLGSGNHAVDFPHLAHIERIASDGCGVCHHVGTATDAAPPCGNCHADLYLPTRVFAHAAHVEALGGNRSCDQCHAGETPASAGPTRECAACHAAAAPGSPWVPRYASVSAPGLGSAAHTLCIGCHRREATRVSPPRPELARCATCHRTPLPQQDAVRPATPASHDVTRE